MELKPIARILEILLTIMCSSGGSKDGGGGGGGAGGPMSSPPFLEFCFCFLFLFFVFVFYKNEVTSKELVLNEYEICLKMLEMTI